MALTPRDERLNSIRILPDTGATGDTVDAGRHASRTHLEQLAEVLAPRHEQILSAANLVDDDVVVEWRRETRDLEESLTAEIEGLEHCLRRVEQARRELIVQAGQAEAPTEADVFDASEGLASDAAGITQRIGRFEIEHELGRGGLGVVLLAYDPILMRRVALKIPRAEALLTPELRQRFQREAQAAARLTHPNIVPVHEVGSVGPICFIAAAYCKGESLAEVLRAKSVEIEPREAAELLAALAEAMHYAHGQGVLHRDLKPGNILLEAHLAADSENGPDSALRRVPKITDFGLAKLMDLASDETRTGVILGTPAYMSPEQALGGKSPLGPETDVYALGAILYELLTGKPPFRGDSDTETLLQVVHRLPVGPRRLRPSLPTDLEAICLRCLEKRPEQRYRTAGELAADLRRFLAGQPTLARPLSPFQSLGRWAARRPTHAALVALGIVASVAALAGVSFHTARLDEALKQAESNASEAIASHAIAERETRRANSELYAAQMRMANLAIERESYERALQILSAYDDGSPQDDLRGIEWHILRSQALRLDHDRDRGFSTLLKHSDDVYTVRFVPRTTLLATGGRDGHVRFWDHGSARVVRDLKQHSGCVNAIRFSPDGAYMATASCDKTLVLWRTPEDAPPEPVHRFLSDTEMWSLDFSPDGGMLAAGDAKGRLVFFDPRNGQVLHTRQLGEHRLDGLNWSPAADRLAVAVYAQASPYWMDYVVGDAWQSVDANHEPLMAADVVFSPDGKRVAVNDRNLRLRQFATATGLELAAAESEGVKVMGLAWDPSGTWLATLGTRGDVRIHDVLTGKLHKKIDVHPPEGHYEDLAFSSDGQLLASAARGGDVFVTQVGLYDARRAVFGGKSLGGYRTYARLDGELRRLSLSACNGYREWTLDSGEMIVDRPLPSIDGVKRDSLAIGRRHLVALANGEVILHDLKEGTTRIFPPELGTNAHQAYLITDSPPIVALVCGAKPGDHANNQLRIINVESFRELYRASCGFGHHSFGLSPDHREVAHVRENLGVELINLETGQKRSVPRTENVRFNAIAFSADGRQLVAKTNFEVWLWDAESLTLKHTFRGHSIAAVEFSPDSRTLAILADNDITLAHTATGQEMVKLPLPQHLTRKASWTRFVMSLTFSADGRRLALVSDDLHRNEFEVYLWGDR